MLTLKPFKILHLWCTWELFFLIFFLKFLLSLPPSAPHDLTPPCVDTKRLRVYIQNVPVCAGTTSTCFIHVDVVTLFSACPTTEPQHTTHNNTPQHTTTHHNTHINLTHPETVNNVMCVGVWRVCESSHYQSREQFLYFQHYR